MASGANYFDEVHGFIGHPDRYQWKLIGKKEMYIPYNLNAFHAAKPEEVYTERPSTRTRCAGSCIESGRSRPR